MSFALSQKVTVSVIYKQNQADAKSMLELVSLCVPQYDYLCISVEGENAHHILQDIEILFLNSFYIE